MSYWLASSPWCYCLQPSFYSSANIIKVYTCEWSVIDVRLVYVMHIFIYLFIIEFVQTVDLQQLREKVLTLERRPDICNVNRGGAKLHPLYLRNGLEFFDAVFIDW